jgi:hypothetical protein
MNPKNQQPRFINDELWKTRKANIDSMIASAKKDYVAKNDHLPFSQVKFNKYIVNDFFQVDPEYWRHMYKGRKQFSDNLIRHIEKRHKLQPGTLDNKDGVLPQSNDYLMQCMLYVREYFYTNKVDITPQQEVKLINDLSLLAARHGGLMDEDFHQLLKQLA